MHCKGSVVEQNKTRPCWLPAETIDSFQFCRRCHFQHITTLLDSFIREAIVGELPGSAELFFQEKEFLNHVLHPAREQALLNLLSIVFETNKNQFQKLLGNLKSAPLFPIVVTKRIQLHQPGTRCQMYRQMMKDKDIYTSGLLCWNCWSCVAWSLKQRDTRFLDMYNNFGYYFSRITNDIFHQTGQRVFLDYLVSLHLLGKEHHIRILLQHFLTILPIEEFRSFLTGFCTQSSIMPVFFEGRQNDFLPVPFQDAIVLNSLKEAIKNCIKRTTDTYKEELMIKTWHPRRLFPWCLDIEEWEDFGVSSTNCTQVYMGFEGL